MRLRHTQAGARCHDNDQAGFVAVFGGRSAFNHLHGLHGISGKLVGENLALLIGDGLAVDENEFEA